MRKKGTKGQKMILENSPKTYNAKKLEYIEKENKQKHKQMREPK